MRERQGDQLSLKKRYVGNAKPESMQATGKRYKKGKTQLGTGTTEKEREKE